MHSFRFSDYLAIRTDPEILNLTYDSESEINYHRLFRGGIASFFEMERSLLFPDAYLALVAMLRNQIHDGDVLCVVPQAYVAIHDALEVIQRIRKNVQVRVPTTGTLSDIPVHTKRLVLISNGIHVAEARILPIDRWYERLCEIHQKRGIPCAFLLEDSHGVGVLGEHGRGTFEHFGIPANSMQPSGVPCFFSGSLAKAFGTSGGFLAGEKKWLKTIRQCDPGCCRDSQYPMSSAVAGIHALVLALQPERRAKLRENVQFFRELLTHRKIAFCGDAELPFVILEQRKAVEASRYLESKGIQVGLTHFTKHPRLRVVVTPAQTREEMTFLAEELAQIK
ncbi:MAG: aminotransferase class I/II-fold pyridoxal phosphate-dependent enzyme [Planctomycetia bacterium]|nr:aminotransferase class I/II-fold pyridoxal phosphate-dependent enzyme [Planctomycetia bacterium]